MAGFDHLPNDIVLELWHHVLAPNDITSFALVSKRVFTLAARALKEYRYLRSRYTVIEYDERYDGSMLSHLLKDLLLNPHIALYVKKLHASKWHTKWEDPLRDRFNDPLHLDYAEKCGWHIPYPEQDMELFKDRIRKLKYLPPHEVDVWIKCLESGQDDPVLAFLLNLLPNICSLSIRKPPIHTILFTCIRRMAENAASTSFTKLKNIQLSHIITDRYEDISVVKPFVLLPSVEKISCLNLDNPNRRRGIPDSLIALQSSNITELVFESCGDISKRISILLEGIKGLKRFTFVAVSEKVDAFWIRSSLLNHCRHSLEYLKMGFSYSLENYIGSLRLFEKLSTIDVEDSLLVDCDAGGHYNIADMLPTSIEAVAMTGRHFATVDGIRPFITNLVGAKQSQLPNLTKLTYHVIDEFIKKKKGGHFNPIDMCLLCERNGIFLSFE